MEAASIYHYQSARDFLRDSIAALRDQDEAFSIRKFCRQCDFGSHAYLVMILKGRRSLTLKQLPALAQGLKLSNQEQMYLQTLIQLDNARNEEERDLFRLWLNDLNPKPEHRIVEVEYYHLIADWIHMAILTLAKIEGSVIDAETIHKLIRGKVSIPNIRIAIDRLIDLGLLHEENGKLSPAHYSVSTPNDVANRGVREYHKQVSKLAVESLEEQDPAIREFQAFALTMPKHKMALAKDLIRKFRYQLVELMEAEPGHEVYQCNLQFFKLAESPLADLPSTENEAAPTGRASAHPDPDKETVL